MYEIRRLSNGNIQFLDKKGLVTNTFLPSCEIIDSGKENIIQISNTGNYKFFGFPWKSVKVLATPNNTFPLPTTKEGFIKLLSEEFFFIGSSQDILPIIDVLSEIENKLSTIILGEKVNNFYYFQFPFAIDFTTNPPPEIQGDVEFYYFDKLNNIRVLSSLPLSGASFSSLTELCAALNQHQALFVFVEIEDLSQIENYTEGNTTIGITDGSLVVLDYVQNSFLLRTDQGDLDSIMLEGFATPTTTAQKLSLQAFQNNNNFLQYTSEANYTTRVMALNTKATTAGDTYLLVGIQAVKNITIVLKNMFGQALTANNANLFVVLNPVFSNSPQFSLPLPGSTLTLLDITAGDPTPQQVTSYDKIIGYFQVEALATAKYNLNKKITLKEDDIIALVIDSPTVGLNAIGYLSWLEQTSE